MRAYLKRGLDVLFPSVCLVCRQDISIGSHQPVCSLCENRFQLFSQVINPDPTFIDAVDIPFIYEGGVRHVMLAFKFSGKDYLAPYMISIWEKYSKLKGFEIDLIMAVPAHPWTEIKRGFNQSELLAREWGKFWSKSLLDFSLLRRHWFSATQRKFGRKSRIENAQKSFYLKPLSRNKLKGKRILLIDDVLTTGATLNACAKLLKKAGARRVYVGAWAFDQVK